MRIPALLATSSLLLTACGPRELNAAQLAYLEEDALAAASEVVPLGAMASLVDLVAPAGTFDPSMSVDENRARLVSRLEARLAGCPDVRISDFSGSVYASGTCVLEGVKYDLLLHHEGPELSNDGSMKLELSTSGSSVNGVSALSDVVVRGASGEVTIQVSDILSGMTFLGTVSRDEGEGLVLEGNGTWAPGSIAEKLPVRVDGMRLHPGLCGATEGVFTIGPRDVLVAEGESISITQEVLFSTSTAPRGAVQLKIGEYSTTGQMDVAPGCLD